MDCKKLLTEELELTRRDAHSPENLAAIYSKRQKRLEVMAKRVVSIEACGGMGSGVILDGNGYIATNAHVIANNRGVCSPITVRTASGWQGKAEFLTGEHEQDIAIIKVSPDATIEGVEIAPEIFLGQDVFAVGHPLGREHTVTKGVISYIRRKINDRPYIQTDTSINPGNSGGGLFDELGRLVGLPTWKEVWADNNRRVPVANIGFAVPGDVVQDYYRKAMQRNLKVGCIGDPTSLEKPFYVD